MIFQERSQSDSADNEVKKRATLSSVALFVSTELLVIRFSARCK
jgi:hypothetical protein